MDELRWLLFTVADAVCLAGLYTHSVANLEASFREDAAVLCTAVMARPRGEMLS